MGSAELGPVMCTDMELELRASIWGRSGAWERRMELGARIEKGGQT